MAIDVGRTPSVESVAAASITRVPCVLQLASKHEMILGTPKESKTISGSPSEPIAIAGLPDTGTWKLTL